MKRMNNVPISNFQCEPNSNHNRTNNRNRATTTNNSHKSHLHRMKKQSSLSSFFSKKKDATVTTETVRKSPRTASKLAASRAAAADKQEENEIYRYPVGTLICKEFDDGWFFGKITEPPFDGRYYTVLYTDGDGETLTHPQAKVAVRAAWLQQNTTPTTTNGDPGLWLDTCLDNTTYSTTSTTSDTTYSSNKNNNSSNKNNNSNVAVYYRYPVGTRLYKEFAAEWFFGTIVEAYIDSDNEEEDKEDSEALDLCSTPSSATATTRRSSTKKVTTVQQQSSSNNNYWYTVTYSDGDAESLSHAAIGPWVHRAEFGAGTTKTPPKRAARSQTPSKRKPSPRRLHVIATATPKRARSQTPSQHKPTPRRRHQQQPPKRSKPKKRQDEDYGADDYHSEEDDISMDGINYEDDDDELEEMNTDDIDDDDDSVSEQSVPKTRSPAKKQTKQQQKVPSQPAMKRSSQPKKGSTTNKKTKTPAAGGAIKVVRRNVNGVVIGYDKAPYEAGNNLPILTDIQEMFDDMVQNKLLGLGSAPTPRSDPLNENAQLLLSMLQTFRHQKANGKNGRRPLRVATMCSGTESPILALDMLEKAIREACDRDERFQSVVSSNETDGINDNQETPAFAVEHVFSCEIEPFKQAYIERNFHPPLLFRDIRELGRDMATTAYGALVPVPGKGTVDLLIAGTSCVDYSNLNNQKKDVEERGESGATFYGMLNWIKKAEPPLVIIENVSGAPWDVKIKKFHEIGYSADFLGVDTKNYYIPHTRCRKYLLAVREDTNKNTTSDIPKQWKSMVDSLKRPASATLDDFLLSNDDPRVLRGRARLTAESLAYGNNDRNSRVDWTKCETRHQLCRSREELGDKKPLTGWSDSGGTTLPSFCWNDWYNAQVHRIHDLTDINTLRLAQSDLDCTYMTMVWNLSQNVDRDTMGKLGLSQCITPTGVPYLTNRGGPLVGEELLMLQGIPVENLILTKETEENLKDLAGNAMSSTVVGACILCALLLGHKSLQSNAAITSSGDFLPSLVPRAMMPISSVTITQDHGDYLSSTASFTPMVLDDSASREQFLIDGSLSTRMCLSEGKDESKCLSLLMKCEACGHTTSRSNALPPRKFEEHVYNDCDGAASRVDPEVFREALLSRLPMLVNITGFDIEQLKMPKGVDNPLNWEQWVSGAQSTLASDGIPTEFRFRRLDRTHIWTALYYSECNARLEARVTKSSVTWLLFFAPIQATGPLKAQFNRPLARMIATSPGSIPLSLMDGQWELSLPVTSRVPLIIANVGDTTIKSWRNRLGLEGGLENEYQYETLRIQIDNSKDHIDELTKSSIDGDYVSLKNCGGPCGSLRKRINDDGQEPMFFFLSSGRNTLPKHNAYMFSRTCHRTTYGEYREILLQTDEESGYCPVFTENKSIHGKLNPTVAIGMVHGRWLVALSAFMSKSYRTTMEVTSPKSFPIWTMGPGSHRLCTEVLSGNFSVRSTDKLFVRCSKFGGHVELNLQKSKQILGDLAFATTRLPLPDAFQNDQWVSLKSNLVSDAAIEGDTVCRKCAPQRPQVKWSLVKTGNRTTFIPIEDGREAAVFERALKARPQPWLVRLSVENDTNEFHVDPSLSFTIACNTTSLVQSALGMFPRETLARLTLIDFPEKTPNATTSTCTFKWRIVRHFEKFFTGFPKLCFSSNKLDACSEQPPHFQKHKLRMEQLRSLSWMISQEATKEPFLEEEVTEAVLPCLDMRAEGLVQRPILVRGGIIADEVGYGKTAITLGLIDLANKLHATPATPAFFSSGWIATNATLVIVPKHMMGQWPNEVKKFLGTSKRVSAIKDLLALNKITIAEIQRADIVIVSFALLSNATYFARLTRLSGLNESSAPDVKRGGRHFSFAYGSCIKTALPSRVEEIQNDTANAFNNMALDVANSEKTDCIDILRVDGKAAAYKEGKSSVQARKIASQEKASEKDPWGLSASQVKKDFSKMTCPPLEMFFWNRLVVDEFTYLAKKEHEPLLEVIYNIKSNFRWFLSGTPKHGDFNDVNSLACLLGIHLGIDELLPSVKLSKKYLKDKESTGFEGMSYYLESRSLQWHTRRHDLGQKFLDRFVRQNIAEIDEIPFEEHQCKISLPPAERAIYMELEAHLESLDMNHSKRLGKRKCVGDRDRRMQTILQTSESGEESLIKCCCHFNMSSDSTAPDTLEQIIDLRADEMEKLIEEMTAKVRNAFQKRQQVLAYQPDWSSVSTTGKGEVQDSLRGYLDDVNNSKSVFQGADDDVHAIIMKVADDAKLAFERENLSKKSNGPRVRVEDMDEDEQFELKHTLRNDIHIVRSLGKEVCGRQRSLRFVKNIQNVLRIESGNIEYCNLDCKHNHSPEQGSLSANEVGSIPRCGHMACMRCLGEEHVDEKCVVPHCRAKVERSHIVCFSTFSSVTNHNNNSRSRFGEKITAIIAKVQEIIETHNERLIIFCQYDDLQAKVKQALSERDIDSLQVKGTVNQQISVVSMFQKENWGESDPYVLLLKMDDEQSAGLNLTNLNHAIFVHPLLASSQQEYEAYETQAIGRIRRYGQKKTVFVWRFLAENTIDTKILAERQGSKLPL